MSAPTYWGRELPRPNERDVSQNTADAAKAVHKVVNVMGEAQAHDLAWLLAADHRSLVQSTMRDLVLPFILHLADFYDEGRYDLRDEGACRLAAEMRDTFMAGEISLPTV